MGLAASQARFLNITNQLSFVQRQGQSINQQRSALASKMNQMLNSNQNQAGAVNPFFTGGGETPEFYQSKNQKGKTNSNNSTSNTQASGFTSLMSSLAAAVSQYPGARKSSMQLDPAELAGIQAEDRRLELMLRTLDTQEQALKTEIAAVTKVIDKNIEQSFKLMA